MSSISQAQPRARLQKLERIAPALVMLAGGAYAADVARSAGVSTVTILNWMDWSWKHRREMESFLHQHHPELNEADLAALWKRVERRREKRRRRMDVAEVLGSRGPSGGAEPPGSR